MFTCAVTGEVLTGNPNQPATREQVIDAAVALNCGSIDFGPEDVVFMNPKSLIDVGQAMSTLLADGVG